MRKLLYDPQSPDLVPNPNDLTVDRIEKYLAGTGIGTHITSLRSAYVKLADSPHAPSLADDGELSVLLMLWERHFQPKIGPAVMKIEL